MDHYGVVVHDEIVARLSLMPEQEPAVVLDQTLYDLCGKVEDNPGKLRFNTD